MNQQVVWTPILYITLSLLVVVAMIILSYFLGQRSHNRERGEVYESGIEATDSARLRFSPQFYLVAMFFVLFDIEAAFIIAWAIAFQELGWVGFTGAAIFIGLLAIVLLYEWRIGALDFGISGKKILKQLKK